MNLYATESVRIAFCLLDERTGNVGICQESDIKLVGIDRSDDGPASSVGVSVLYTYTNGAAAFHQDAIDRRVTSDRSAMIGYNSRKRFYQLILAARTGRLHCAAWPPLDCA